MRKAEWLKNRAQLEFLKAMWPLLGHATQVRIFWVIFKAQPTVRHFAYLGWVLCLPIRDICMDWWDMLKFAVRSGSPR